MVCVWIYYQWILIPMFRRRKLWTDHTLWLKLLMDSVLTNSGAIPTNARKLSQITKDIGIADHSKDFVNAVQQHTPGAWGEWKNKIPVPTEYSDTWPLQAEAYRRKDWVTNTNEFDKAMDLAINIADRVSF